MEYVDEEGIIQVMCVLNGKGDKITLERQGNQMREDRQTQSQIRINSVGNMNRNTSKAVMYGKSITTDSSEHRLEAGFHDRQNKMKAQERTSVIFCPIARLDSLPHSFADSEENRLHSSFFRRRRLFNFISRQTFCPFL